MKKKQHLLALATAALTLLPHLSWSQATAPSTIAYWRFEDEANPGKDSGPDRIDLTQLGDLRVMPNDGPSASNVNLILQNGESNSFSLSISQEDGALFSEAVEKFVLEEFTVEGIIRVGTEGRFAHIVSRWGKGASSWRLAFNSTEWTLSFALSQNGRDIVPFALPVPDTKVGDYLYVAAKVSVNASTGSKVELLAQNLSRQSPLERATQTNPDASIIFEGNAPISIGGVGLETGDKQNWRGRIDEVRISSGLLPDESLLIRL